MAKQSTENDRLTWEEIRTEHIVQDEWIDFKRSAYRFPDGSVFEPYYSYSRRDYVVIVASDTEGNYLCVRQFRQGIKTVTTEFPAGGIESKDSKFCAESAKGEADELHAESVEIKVGEFHGKSEESETGKVCCEGEKTTVEEALLAAKRELLEETGYESDEWRHLLTVPSNATLADNYAYLFVARNCKRVSGQSLDDTEFLNVKKYSALEIEEMIKNGEFQQAVHVAAWLLACRR